MMYQTGTMVEINLDAEKGLEGERGSITEPVQALMKCLDCCGQVNIPYICNLTDMDADTVINELKGAIIRNPDCWNGEYTDGFETTENYISGNLAAKLDTAKRYNDKYNGLFEENIEAINAAKPSLSDDRTPYATLGSPWIPPEIIDDFIVYLLGKCKKHDTHAQYDHVTGLWSIPYAALYSENVKNTDTYGTTKINALKIIEKTLNAQSIEIMKPQPSWSKVKEAVDREETALALERQREIQELFDGWLYSDEDRKEKLCKVYNEMLGGIIGRRYDGSFLTFPGMNPDIKLRPNQKNGAARIIFSKNVLLVHDVGTGKTYTMIAAGHELRRMGISLKNMYVVPNAIIGQWEESYRQLYPDAHILVVDKRNFGKEKRQSTLALVRDGEYDAIIIAASSFSMIPLSRKYRIEELERQKTELTQAMIYEKGVQRKIVSRQIDRLNTAIGKLREEIDLAKLMGVSEGICFDDLGITTLFVDEAHEYKNITVKVRSKAVFGMARKGSSKCDNMLAKVRLTQRKGRGAVFATATPICNSMSDVFIMQTYLQHGELKFLGLSSFDNWANTFARREDALEIDVDGTSLRTVTRLAHFYNIPELSALFTQVADFFAEGKSTDTCRCDIIDVKVSCPQELKDFLLELSERADMVRKGHVSRKDDNLLKITVDGKLAALDMRIFEGKWCDPEKTKSFRCAQIVYDIWRQTEDERLTQIIFCDLSTPKKGFNVYNEVRFQLMKLGVPMKEIAFIHDAETEAEKMRLFEKVNRGDIRILMGSTPKLGTGVNVQRKLFAVHHLDVPWRPSDMVQREGRMLREGNTCNTTRVYRYVTKHSFDAFSWSLLERKQRFIAEFMTNNVGEDAACDLEEMTLSYAEIKALAVGNPLIRRRMRTENDLNRMSALNRAYLAQRRKAEEELKTLPDRAWKQEMREHDLLCDWITVCGAVPPDREERRALGEELLEALKNNVMHDEERLFDTFMGLDVLLPANMLAEKPCVILSGSGRYVVPMGDDVFGNVRRLDNAAMGLEKRHLEASRVREEMGRRIQALKEELARPNEYAEKIEELRRTLAEYDRELRWKPAAV